MQSVRHPILWLKSRDRFWPSAIRYGWVWVKYVAGHPLASLAAWIITGLTLVGVVLLVPLDPLTGLLVLVILWWIVVAKGARLKWKAERAGHTTIPSGQSVILQAGATYNEIHHNYGTPPAGTPQLWLPPGVEVRTTDVQIRTEPPAGQEGT